MTRHEKGNRILLADHIAETAFQHQHLPKTRPGATGGMVNHRKVSATKPGLRRSKARMKRARQVSSPGMSNIDWPKAQNFDADIGKAKIIEFIEKVRVGEHFRDILSQFATVTDLAVQFAVGIFRGAPVQRSADACEALQVSCVLGRP